MTQISKHRNVYRIEINIRIILHNDSGGGKLGLVPPVQSSGNTEPRDKRIKPGNKKRISRATDQRSI